MIETANSNCSSTFLSLQIFIVQSNTEPPQLPHHTTEIGNLLWVPRGFLHQTFNIVAMSSSESNNGSISGNQGISGQPILHSNSARGMSYQGDFAGHQDTGSYKYTQSNTAEPAEALYESYEAYLSTSQKSKSKSKPKLGKSVKPHPEQKPKAKLAKSKGSKSNPEKKPTPRSQAWKRFQDTGTKVATKAQLKRKWKDQKAGPSQKKKRNKHTHTKSPDTKPPAWKVSPHAPLHPSI